MSSHVNQLSSKIQESIKHRDQTKNGVNFYFPEDQLLQVKEWKRINIICENFEIIDQLLAILKSESNTILIHPTVCSFAEDGYIGCFQYFEMESIEIPNSITSLGNGYCYQCLSLTQISLPNSITSLGDYCFSGCSSLYKFLFLIQLLHLVNIVF
jgi:hypothetical protein